MPFGAWCSGPFAIAAISIHPYLPSWLVPDRSLRHGHSNVCVIHLCKCVCEGGKDVFFSARNYFFFTKSLSRARVCTTPWLSVDCVGRAYVARGWHLCRYYGGPVCVLPTPWSAPAPTSMRCRVSLHIDVRPLSLLYFLNLAGIHCVTPCTPLSAYLSANCSKRMSDQTVSAAMRLRGCMSAQTLQEHVCTCNVYNISNVSIFPSSSAVALP